MTVLDKIVIIIAIINKMTKENKWRKKNICTTTPTCIGQNES